MTPIERRSYLETRITRAQEKIDDLNERVDYFRSLRDECRQPLAELIAPCKVGDFIEGGINKRKGWVTRIKYQSREHPCVIYYNREGYRGYRCQTEERFYFPETIKVLEHINDEWFREDQFPNKGHES